MEETAWADYQVALAQAEVDRLVDITAAHQAAELALAAPTQTRRDAVKTARRDVAEDRAAAGTDLALDQIDAEEDYLDAFVVAWVQAAGDAAGEIQGYQNQIVSLETAASNGVTTAVKTLLLAIADTIEPYATAVIGANSNLVSDLATARQTAATSANAAERTAKQAIADADKELIEALAENERAAEEQAAQALYDYLKAGYVGGAAGGGFWTEYLTEGNGIELAFVQAAQPKLAALQQELADIQYAAAAAVTQLSEMTNLLGERGGARKVHAVTTTTLDMDWAVRVAQESLASITARDPELFSYIEPMAPVHWLRKYPIVWYVKYDHDYGAYRTAIVVSSGQVVDFSAGFANGFFLGIPHRAADWLGVKYDDVIDVISHEFMAGQIMGTVVITAISIYAGAACGVPAWMVRAVAAMDIAGGVVGAIGIAENVYNYSRTGNLDKMQLVFDILDTLPLLGFIGGKLAKAAGGWGCFVAGTPVVVGEQTVYLTSEAAVGAFFSSRDLVLASGGTLVLLGVSGCTLVSIEERKRRQRRAEERLDDLFGDEEGLEEALDADWDDEPFASPSLDEPGIAGGRSVDYDKPWSGNAMSSVSARRTPPAVAVPPSSRRSHARPTASRCGWVILLSALCVLLGIPLLWAGFSQPGAPTPAAANSPRSKLVLRPIEGIRVGQRTLGRNPDRREVDETELHIDQAAWRHVILRAPKGTSDWSDVELLRPVWWLTLQTANVGSSVLMDVPECGISSPAEVLEIRPCPLIEAGPGNVVTGTFRHHGAWVLDLHIEGMNAPVTTTPNHLFWSVDRHAFVRADSQRRGERLQSSEGVSRVGAAVQRTAQATVYNLQSLPLERPCMFPPKTELSSCQVWCTWLLAPENVHR